MVREDEVSNLSEALARELTDEGDPLRAAAFRFAGELDLAGRQSDSLVIAQHAHAFVEMVKKEVSQGKTPTEALGRMVAPVLLHNELMRISDSDR
jgi:hypothetical protein